MSAPPITVKTLTVYPDKVEDVALVEFVKLTVIEVAEPETAKAVAPVGVVRFTALLGAVPRAEVMGTRISSAAMRFARLVAFLVSRVITT